MHKMLRNEQQMLSDERCDLLLILSQDETCRFNGISPMLLRSAECFHYPFFDGNFTPSHFYRAIQHYNRCEQRYGK
jgi:undecaprenyl pyrophosphate synthase